MRAMIRRDADARAGDIATLRPTDLIERDDRRHPLAGRAGHPPGHPRPVVLRPAVQLRPRRATTGGCSATRSPTTRSTPATRSPRRRRSSGSIARSATRPACGSSACSAGRDHYLTEIASALELSKPTIKHHLALLRAAGLVTLTEEGGLSYYSLRRGHDRGERDAG